MGVGAVGFVGDVVYRLRRGRGVVFVAPTGFGKTVVALEAYRILERMGLVDRMVYLVPTRSLAVEKKLWFEEYFPRRVAIVTGEYPAFTSVVAETRVVVATYFKFVTLVSKYISPRTLLVLDEIHRVLGLPEVQAEISYALYRGARVLGLTATLSRVDRRYVASWIGGEVLDPGVERPVRLQFRVVSLKPVYFKGNRYYRTDMFGRSLFRSRMDVVGRLVRRLVRDGKVMVWLPFRKDADNYAVKIAEYLGRMHGYYFDSGTAYFRVNNQHDLALQEAYNHGVLIHHGGLSSKNRNKVLELARTGNFNVIVTCYTLLQGVNLPVKYLIIPRIRTLNGVLGATEFWQLSGRVGRPGLVDSGEVYILADPVEKEYVDGYLLRTDSDAVEIVLPSKWFMSEYVENVIVHLKNMKKLHRVVSRSLYAVVYGEEEIKRMTDEIVEWLKEVYGIKVYDDGRVWLPDRSVYYSMLVGLYPLLWKRFVKENTALSLDEIIRSIVINYAKANNMTVAPTEIQALMRGYYASKTSDLRDIVSTEFEKLIMVYGRLYGYNDPRTQKLEKLLMGWYFGFRGELLEKLADCGVGFKELRYLADMDIREPHVIYDALEHYYLMMGVDATEVLKCLEKKLGVRKLF